MSFFFKKIKNKLYSQIKKIEEWSGRDSMENRLRLALVSGETRDILLLHLTGILINISVSSVT
jgi:hypothetical protein